MSYQINKIIVNLTLGLMLLGQADLFALESCDMSPDTPMEMNKTGHDHTTMAHNQSNNMNNPEKFHVNCCDTLECSCLDSACSTSLISTLEQNLETELVRTTKITTLDLRLSSANSQLLIRPPIIV